MRRPKPKVVFDTNIYISAIIFGGNPRTCLELARTKEINLISSKVLLLELSEKLKKKFEWPYEDIREVIEGLSKFVKVVEPKHKIEIIKADPSDNKVLECALETNADFIISGDKKHVLSLKKFINVQIISAKDFLKIYYR